MSYTPHSADSIRLFRAESSIPARNDQPYAADTQETVGFFRVKIPGKNHRVSSASTTRTKSSGFFLCLKNTGKYLLYVKTRTIITKGSRALQTRRKPSGFFALKSPTKIIGFLLRQQPAQNHRVFFLCLKNTGKYLLYVKTRTIITKGSRALQTCRKPSGYQVCFGCFRKIRWSELQNTFLLSA